MEKLRSCYRNCLKFLEDHDELRTMALPGISTGVFGMSIVLTLYSLQLSPHETGDVVVLFMPGFPVLEGAHVAAQTVLEGAHVAAQTVLEGAHVAAQTVLEGAHVAAQTVLEGAHVAAQTVLEGAHVAAQTVRQWLET